MTARRHRAPAPRTLALLALTLALLVMLVSPQSAAAADPTLVLQWGASGSGDGQFSLPNDLAVGPGGIVYVADSNNNRIQKFTSDGAFLSKWGTFGIGDGQFKGAEGVAPDAAGNVYVADFGNQRVQEFTANGAFIRKWGTQGSGDGQFFSPRGVAVDGAGNVLVLEFAGHRVQKFTPTGQFVGKWGTNGTGDGQFVAPTGIAIDGSGNVYVADRGNNRVQKFTSSGQFLGKWGSRGTGLGQFGSPNDVAIAPDGNVLVSDFDNNRIQKFTPGGAFVSTFNRLAPRSETFRPGAMVFNPAGDLYIEDWKGGAGNRILKVREAAPPVLGRKVNVASVSGRVFLKLPGRRSTLLSSATQIPVGSQLDTRRGTVRLTSAANSRGAVQSGDFSAGVFSVRQSRGGGGLTDVNLSGGSYRGCVVRGAGRAVASRLSSRVVRRVRANGRGRFRTRGRYSAATVRGTIWDTTDRCDGTLTRVRRGVVVVRDLRKRRNVTVRAGKSYLARAG
jgi:DNA-binding beta-propeller fold protein YncE